MTTTSTTAAIAPRRPRPRGWWQTVPARAVRDFLQRRVFWPLLKYFFRTRNIEGLEKLDDLKEPAIFVVVKHASHFDTPALMSAVPPRIRHRLTMAAAKDYFFDRFVVLDKLVSLLLNAFPFDRKHPKISLRQLVELLNTGWSIAIYGEGTRGTDGKIHEMKRGPAAIVSYTRRPVILVFMDGPGDILPKGSWCPRRADVTIRFSRILRFPDGLHSQIIHDELEARLHALSQGNDPPLDVHLVDWSKPRRRAVAPESNE